MWLCHCCIFSDLSCTWVSSTRGTLFTKHVLCRLIPCERYCLWEAYHANFSLHFERLQFNEWPFTVHVPIRVNIWDPILCAHLGICYVLKLGWWWLHEQPRHVATRDLTLYLFTIEIVVSGRKYTYAYKFAFSISDNEDAREHILYSGLTIDHSCCQPATKSKCVIDT